MSVTLSGYTLAKPSSAPTAAAGTATGNLDASAAYGYKVTYVTGFGETDPNTTAASVTTTTTGSVNLTAIPTSSNANVIARKLYRTVGAGSSYLLLATLEDNTTATYTDTIADDDLGAAAPTVNTAHSLQNVDGGLKISKPAIFSVENSITATAGGGQTNAHQITSEYNRVSVSASTGDSVKLPGLDTTTIGMHVRIRNDGASAVDVFPFLGQSINALSANTAQSLATGSIDYVAVSATAWRQM